MALVVDEAMRRERHRAITRQDEADWAELTARLPWREAKTYRQTAPHSYILCGRTAGITDDEFLRGLRVQRTFGQPGKFYRRTNIYWEHDGCRYFTDSNPLHKHGVINRACDDRNYGEQDAPVTQTASAEDSSYDGISSYLTYGRRYRPSAEDWDTTRKALWASDSGFGGRSLDIGCAGPRVTYAPLGLMDVMDSSRGMLNHLVMDMDRRMPKVAGLIPADMNEPGTWEHLETYPLVTALMGTASYLTERGLDLVLDHAERAVLQVYTQAPRHDRIEGFEPPARPMDLTRLTDLVRERGCRMKVTEMKEYAMVEVRS